MDVWDVVKERRSIHDFQPRNVEEKVLLEILQTAAWAPTHRMKEPWELILFQENGRLQYVEEVLKSYERQGFFRAYTGERTQAMKDGIRQYLFDIPHHLLIYMEKDEDELKFHEDYAAVCAYIQNLHLLAWTKQIGVLWTTSPYVRDEDFLKGIGLSDSYIILGVLQMGYIKSVPRAKPRTPIQQKLTIRRS